MLKQVLIKRLYVNQVFHSWTLQWIWSSLKSDLSVMGQEEMFCMRQAVVILE
jgi:hypothetical protein